MPLGWEGDLLVDLRATLRISHDLTHNNIHNRRNGQIATTLTIPVNALKSSGLRV